MLALITGVGARGQVGEAVAEAFLRRGDSVLFVSRSPDEAAERFSELSRLGSAQGYACDLTKPNEVGRLAEQIRSEHGDSLDALVNLAGGFGSTGPLAKSDPAAFTRLFDINVKTAYLATRAFLAMLESARGSVVFFASEAALEGAKTTGVAGYVAAKTSVLALMRSVADEGRTSGVRANALAPAAIRTTSNEASMPANTRFVERDQVADAVLYLCSPQATAVSGQVIRLR